MLARLAVTAVRAAGSWGGLVAPGLEAGGDTQRRTQGEAKRRQQELGIHAGDGRDALTNAESEAHPAGHEAAAEALIHVYILDRKRAVRAFRAIVFGLRDHL